MMPDAAWLGFKGWITYQQGFQCRCIEWKQWPEIATSCKDWGGCYGYYNQNNTGKKAPYLEDAGKYR